MTVFNRATKTAERSAASASRADADTVELLDFTATRVSEAVRSAAAIIARAVIWAGSDTGGVSQRAIALFLEDVALAELPRQLVWSDFSVLAEKNRQGAWTNSTPVPPSVFDPLDDPDAESPAKVLVVEMFATEGTDPADIGSSLVKLWEAANEYHMARGGGVLTFDEFKQMMPARVPVGPKFEG